MNARTKTLFHITGKRNGLNDLMQILGDQGFWPQYSLEDVAWLEAPNVSKVAWPMVCFCDIAILRLREHASRYGGYGIGLCRDQFMFTGLNPLLYVARDSTLKESLQEIIKDASLSSNPLKRTNGMVLVAHCKPLEEHFYSECEWRYVPFVEGAEGVNEFGYFLSEENFRDHSIREMANAERRKDGLLPFCLDEVRYLLVKTKEDVPKLINFIDTKIANYTPLGLDMLKTRIVVLDEISRDL